MQRVLIASDSESLLKELQSVLDQPDLEIVSAKSGPEVMKSAKNQLPDLAIVDMQIGTMGGMAICMDLRLEESGNRVGHVPVLLLLDRRPDVFLARRCGADGWIVKPLDPLRLRKAMNALLNGEEFHDDFAKPESVTVPESQTQ